jgi:hypothetical protein
VTLRAIEIVTVAGFDRRKRIVVAAVEDAADAPAPATLKVGGENEKPDTVGRELASAAAAVDAVTQAKTRTTAASRRFVVMDS